MTDKELVGYIMTGMIVLFVLAWKPLHNRFTAQAIIVFYLLSGLSVPLAVMIYDDPGHAKDLWVPLFAVASGAMWLFTFKREVRSFIPATSYWKVVQGLWHELEKEGLPPNQIERLKRMTPEERARELRASIIRAQTKAKQAKWKPDDEDDDWVIYMNPYSYDYGNTDLIPLPPGG